LFNGSFLNAIVPICIFHPFLEKETWTTYTSLIKLRSPDFHFDAVC